MLKLKHKEKWKEYTEIKKSCILGETFEVRLEEPQAGKCYVKCGDDNILYSKIIFERKSGSVTIGDRCHLGGGTSIISVNSVEIGSDVIISWGVTIYDHNSHSIYWEERKSDVLLEKKALCGNRNLLENKNWDVVVSKPIRIEDKVWIGFGASIMKGVTIGEGAVVAANSVVVKDVPPYTIVGGNPARIIKRINNEKTDGKR